MATKVLTRLLQTKSLPMANALKEEGMRVYDLFWVMHSANEDIILMVRNIGNCWDICYGTPGDVICQPKRMLAPILDPAASSLHDPLSLISLLHALH
jgi:hypothetical protein